MSDKEASPPRSRSRSVGSEGDSRKASKSRSRSRSRSRRSYRSRSYNKRSYSRSRSRSRSRGRRYKSRSRSPYYGGSGSRRRSRYSRSRSRSPYHRRSSRYSPDEYSGRSRYRSRSPMSRRKRHIGTRDNPTTSRCIGVFGLSLYTQERDLREVFNRYGPIEEVQIVYDHQTGRSRGFAFIYYRNTEDAEEAKDRAPGTEIDGHKIRVDYSITERAHTPTPGIYLGKPTSRYGGGGGRSSRDDYYRRRSPSPYYRRSSRYSRSRSRSYTPRRY